MTSAINPLWPITGTPTTESVRQNFATAKSEIEALQLADAQAAEDYAAADAALALDFANADAALAAKFPNRTLWTPQLAIGGASTGITYAAQRGYFIRAGDLDFWHLMITLSSKGALTGALTIVNFPAQFQAALFSPITSPISPYAATASLTGTVYGQAMQGSPTLRLLMQSGGTLVEVTHLHLNNNTMFTASFCLPHTP